MTKNFITAVIAAPLLLAGCGGGAPGTGNATGDTAQKPEGGGSKPPAGWNAADACSVVDKAKMAAAIGKEVSETSLSLATESDGTTAATSECTYMLAEGGRASVMLRWSPISDNAAGAIAQTHGALKQSVAPFGGSVDTVDGVGKAAFWVAGIGSLNVFIGDDKFAIINLPRGDKAKEQAIALARQLGA